MPGTLTTRPHRTRGSWIPRLAGVGIAVLLVGGGLAFYLSSTSTPGKSTAAKSQHRNTAGLSARVLKAQTVGVIDFGPSNDGDPFLNDPDDHPLKLQPAGADVDFVAISVAEVAAGVPQWNADQMADGTVIFIYVPTGQCLSASSNGKLLVLAHCDLGLSQRWRPELQAAALGQAYAEYASAKTGGCLTAPKHPGLAMIAPCGGGNAKSQEIAYWWSA
jgi:hypothetical protein